jgi:hypothetical protein
MFEDAITSKIVQGGKSKQGENQNRGNKNEENK